MREVSTDEITKNIKEMCIEANYILSDDVKNKIINSAAVENSEIGKKIFSLPNPFGATVISTLSL